MLPTAVFPRVSDIAPLYYSLSTNDFLSFLTEKTEGASPLLTVSNYPILTALGFVCIITYPGLGFLCHEEKLMLPL